MRKTITILSALLLLCIFAAALAAPALADFIADPSWFVEDDGTAAEPPDGLVGIMILFFLGGGAVITVIVMVIEVKRHRPVKMASDADHYITSGGIETAEDTFIRTHTKKIKIEKK